jgi:ATP-dependent protease HslVU (ClpYQ) peptidase subunit
MTTVAANRLTMAGDSQVTAGIERVATWVKVWRFNDAIYGTAGNLTDCMKFKSWQLEYGQDPEKAPELTDEFSAMCLNKRGLFFFNKELIMLKTRGFHAIGSGSDYAIGAMAHGATPERAVRLTIKLDVNSGGRVRSLSL